LALRQADDFQVEGAEVVVVATPDYLARVGAPQDLDDLARHECIRFELPSSGRRIAWLFNDGGRPCEILAQSAYVCSDDVLGGVTLAKHARACSRPTASSSSESWPRVHWWKCCTLMPVARGRSPRSIRKGGMFRCDCVPLSTS
jgi:DNA-binding transcriptional LysR family regulator